MTKRLTGRQKLFAKHYALGKSGKQAAILAGYSERSADVIASENLTKPNVISKIEEILDTAGLSDKALAKRLKKSIDAGLGISAKNADALKGIKMAYQLKDRFPSTKHRVESTHKSEIELRLESKSEQEIHLFIQEITAKTQKYIERFKVMGVGEKRENRQGQEKLIEVVQETAQTEHEDQKVLDNQDDGARKAIPKEATRPSFTPLVEVNR